MVVPAYFLHTSLSLVIMSYSPPCKPIFSFTDSHSVPFLIFCLPMNHLLPYWYNLNHFFWFHSFHMSIPPKSFISCCSLNSQFGFSLASLSYFHISWFVLWFDTISKYKRDLPRFHCTCILLLKKKCFTPTHQNKMNHTYTDMLIISNVKCVGRYMDTQWSTVA